MPRQLRDKNAGVFHVFARCVYASKALYRDDVDRLEFLRYLARTTARSGWTCIAFCLMTTHYHLIVAVEKDVLPKAMHSLNLAYAQAFNRRHGLKGHVQFRRYGAKRISGDGDLLTRYRYVVRNPVRAGLCEFAADWQWSSFAGSVGLAAPHTFIDATCVISSFSEADELIALVNESR
jgi:REP element-mobilizing transposase RayT